MRTWPTNIEVSPPEKGRRADRALRGKDARTWYESHERVLESTQLLNGCIGSVEHDLRGHEESGCCLVSKAGINLKKGGVAHPSLQHQEFEEHERLESEAIHQFPQGGA